MHQITSAEFRAAVELDPAWASKLTKPTGITGFCDMGKSNITHLSPLLHFLGKNEWGNSTYFCNCRFLEIAEGNFEGLADFHGSNIKKIGALTCGVDRHGNSASFYGCESLKVAEGTYPGFVNFNYTKIKKIGNLSCGKNSIGNSAFFWECRSLKVAEGKFTGFVDFSDSRIEKIGDLSCGKNQEGIRFDVTDCSRLKKIPISFNPREIKGDTKLIEELTTDRLKRAARKLFGSEEIYI